MHSETVFVTPETAKAWLQKSAGNRPLHKRKLEEYKTSMLSGRWQLTPQSIDFDEEGKLRNGHHRLTAVVESGCGVWMYVTYGVPKDTTAYDIGAARSTIEYLRYNVGVDPAIADNTFISITRMHFYFLSKERRHIADRMGNEDIRDFILENAETFRVINPMMRTRRSNQAKLRSSPFGYALFCAVKCGVPTNILYRFCDVVASGFAESKGESAAIVIRNKISGGIVQKSADMPERAAICKVIQQGIKDFAAGNPRVRAYKPDSAPYTTMYLMTCKGESDGQLL